MTHSHLEKALHAALVERLQSLGFLPVRTLAFSQFCHGCKKLIRFGGRIEGGKLKFTCTLGVRFDEIEALLRPDENSVTLSTISCPIHLLAAERTYYEWEADDVESVSIAAESAVQEITKVEAHFFDRFAALDAVKNELSGSDPMRYCILSEHQRIGILAAIALLRGERPAAEGIVSNALSDPKNQDRGTLRQLEMLRLQLFAN